MNDKVKKLFQPGPMVSFRSPRNLSNYLVRAKMYPLKRKTGSCKCKGNRCQVCLNVSETQKFTGTVTNMSYKINHSFLNATTNAWYIFWHVRLVLSSMLVVSQIVSDIVGITANVMTENLREGRLVWKNIFLNILIVKGLMGSYMTFHLHWSIKLMQKILSNENTTGDIPSKRWHLMVLMLKMIVKLQLTYIYILLVPGTGL